MLEGGEERVEFGERCAVRGFQILHGSDAVDEFALHLLGRDWHPNPVKQLHGQILGVRPFRDPL